jgi:hypothetical protein
MTVNLAVNLLLAFFLISILADGILDYKVGFVLSSPTIILILITFIFSYLKYFSRQNSEIRNATKTIVLIIIGLMVVSIYSFNMLCWIDFFDGKTNALLP